MEAGAAQTDTVEEKPAASGSEDSDDESSVWPRFPCCSNLYQKVSIISIALNEHNFLHGSF